MAYEEKLPCSAMELACRWTPLFHHGALCERMGKKKPPLLCVYEHRIRWIPLAPRHQKETSNLHRFSLCMYALASLTLMLDQSVPHILIHRKQSIDLQTMSDKTAPDGSHDLPERSEQATITFESWAAEQTATEYVLTVEKAKIWWPCSLNGSGAQPCAILDQSSLSHSCGVPMFFPQLKLSQTDRTTYKLSAPESESKLSDELGPSPLFRQQVYVPRKMTGLLMFKDPHNCTIET